MRKTAHKSSVNWRKSMHFREQRNRLKIVEKALELKETGNY
jgi:hypothetical protein